MSHDASGNGIRVVSRSTLDVGAQVTVAFRLLPDEPKEREIKGHVVRVGENDLDPEGLWPCLMAIEFEEAVADLDLLLRDHATAVGDEGARD